MNQQDALDREEDALRSWVSRYRSAGNLRQAETIQRDIDLMWEMRARRGWTSRLRPWRHGVEDFSTASARPMDDWTRETDD